MNIPASHTHPAGEGDAYWCDACEGEHIRITKVIDSCVPKPALVPWAFKCGKEGRDIEAEKLAGGDRGTAIHDFLEQYIGGFDPKIAELDEKHQPYAVQLLKFMQDYEPVFEASEILIVHHELGYAGTMDGIARITRQPKGRNKPWDLTGKRVLFDLKTSRDGRVYAPAHHLQVAGYALAWESMGGEQPDEQVIVAVGESSYQLAVSYFQPEAFRPLIDFYMTLQNQKGRNPNARGKR
jgi:hypothetical protein